MTVEIRELHIKAVVQDENKFREYVSRKELPLLLRNYLEQYIKNSKDYDYEFK